MKPELKAKWIAALRSGKYPQGKGYLRRDGKFCCWGVLRDVADPNDSRQGATGRIVTEQQLKEWGFDPFYHTNKLENMNDGKQDTPSKSFYEIADWIERHL